MSLRRFEVLDSWRGICAIFVALFHFQPVFYFAEAGLIRSSWRFVDFFFVLSGFVITHGYADSITTRGHFVGFATKRFLRLYPLHLFTFLIFFGWFVFSITRMRDPAALAALYNEISPIRIFVNLTLLQGFLPWQEIGFNSVSWSISVEFWTYLIFGLLCLYWRKHLLILQVCLAIASLCLLYINSDPESVWYANMVRCVAGFSVGSICYLFIGTKTNSFNRIAMSAIEIAVIAEVVFFLSVSEKKDTLMWLSPLVFVQLVAVFSFQKGAISQTLQRNPLARSAGLYSYSIYMLHPFLFSMAVFAMAKVNLTLSAGRATLVIIGLVGILLVLSRIAYNHIEMLGLSLVRAKRLLVTPS